jgi:hypothetical protein
VRLCRVLVGEPAPAATAAAAPRELVLGAGGEHVAPLLRVLADHARLHGGGAAAAKAEGAGAAAANGGSGADYAEAPARERTRVAAAVSALAGAVPAEVFAAASGSIPADERAMLEWSSSAAP